MKKYIALLRGVNVGGRNKLPMGELKEILETQKCLDVKTYIQSGNAVFKHKRINVNTFKSAVQNGIQKRFGFSPDILIVENKDFNSAIRENPFKSKTGKDLHFFFLESQAKNADLQKLESFKIASEKVLLKKNIFYLYAPGGVGRSKLASNVEKCLGVSVTARNFNTIEKLKFLLDEDD